MKRVVASACLLAAALAWLGGSGCRKDGSGAAAVDASEEWPDGTPAVIYVESAGETGSMTSEREPNDDTAGTLVVPGGVSGRIDRAGDVDRFAFRLEATTSVRVRLVGAEGADLTLELLDAAGKSLVKSDNGPAGAVEGVSDRELPPGAYELRVAEFTKKGAAARVEPSPPYELRVRPAGAPGEGEEKEPNEDAAFAGLLDPAVGASGHIGWRKDRDVWRLAAPTMTEDEALAVDVSAVDGVALELAVLGGTEERWITRKGGKGEAVSVRNLSVPLGEEALFFVVSTSGAGNPETRYDLSVKPMPLEVGDELEPNDDLARANPLSDLEAAQGGDRVGFLEAGDTDLYRVEPRPDARRLTVSITVPAGVDARLAFLGADGQPLAEADAGARGAAETLPDLTLAPGDAAYIRVSTKRGADAASRYKLSWSFTPG